jgi:hypothetical protein
MELSPHRTKISGCGVDDVAVQNGVAGQTSSRADWRSCGVQHDGIWNCPQVEKLGIRGQTLIDRIARHLSASLYIFSASPHNLRQALGVDSTILHPEQD